MPTTPLSSRESDLEAIDEGHAPADPDRANGQRSVAPSVQVTGGYEPSEAAPRVPPKRKRRKEDNDPLQSPTNISRAP
ncbi:unnamed protein product [Phytophthora fragariaefolia]|uniref:Unnamed protein product n=1 Tax=Phytophthora fragariaefolia TaxID=1490495 RepID=A0A9W6YAQ4_9STRA|nr:unnamed protein product [Phytophthora fragariaefolia]